MDRFQKQNEHIYKSSSPKAPKVSFSSTSAEKAALSPKLTKNNNKKKISSWNAQVIMCDKFYLRKIRGQFRSSSWWSWTWSRCRCWSWRLGARGGRRRLWEVRENRMWQSVVNEGIDRFGCSSERLFASLRMCLLVFWPFWECVYWSVCVPVSEHLFYRCLCQVWAFIHGSLGYIRLSPCLIVRDWQFLFLPFYLLMKDPIICITHFESSADVCKEWERKWKTKKK